MGTGQDFSGDYITAPALSLAANQAVTFSAWIHPDTLGSYARILDAPGDLDLALDSSQDSSLLWEINSENAWFGESPVPLSTWQHVCAVHKGASLEVGVYHDAAALPSYGGG